ncbi:hypothetical protein F4780DRAFT_788082 [Xylariomycetidae sp. FL0641]|nr:hypothetical protein F4780DRAFT_788082 [Xylariomycetidae sp. FL0641]
MATNAFGFMATCIGDCLHLKRSQRATTTRGAERRGDHYNAQLRANIGLPERPLQLPARVEAENTSGNPTPRRGPSPAPAPAADNDNDNDARATSPRPPRIRTTGRFPTTTTAAGAGAGAPRWATSNMTRAELAELFDVLHALLEQTGSGVPYAVCGLGALLDHGCAARRASKVSILCPAHSRHNVGAWAAAHGYERYADSIGLPLRGGAVRRVRVKYLDAAAFDALQVQRSGISAAAVLGLASTLDHVAAGWLERAGRGDDDDDDGGSNERALRTIADDVFWCLRHAAQHRVPLPERYLPTFLGEAFWAGFTAAHPHARPEVARAGVDVARVLARHRDAAALREHDAMLRQFGLRGDVPAERPGAFEGLRDLANSRSVYTLRGDRDSARLSDTFVLPASDPADAAPCPVPVPVRQRIAPPPIEVGGPEPGDKKKRAKLARKSKSSYDWTFWLES